MNRRTDIKKLEEHPLYPSCEWEGFYTYEGFAGKDKMDFYLEFMDGKITGFGEDAVGRFVWKGLYDKYQGTCSMVKHYTGKHQVFYSGYVDENGIWGKWFIAPFSTGGFHIWPRKEGKECNAEEISEEEIDVLEEKILEIEVEQLETIND